MASNTLNTLAKKRVPLAKLDDDRTKRVCTNNNSLTCLKMAHATRTFRTQAEAAKYVIERQENEKDLFIDEILYLFSFESPKDGTRRYQVADIDVFIKEYFQLPASQRHYYEIIVEKKPSKLYFDLEFDIAANPNIDGPKLTTDFIQFVLNFMKKRSDDLSYEIKDVVILDSTSATKFSRHLIFQMADAFLDNQDVGKFVNSILEDIHGCLLNHQCSAIPNSSSQENFSPRISWESSVFSKNLLLNIEPHLSKFARCTCTDDLSELPFKEIVKFIVRKNDNNGITWFCDMGVYTKNRAFRLYLSSKFDKKEFFVLAPENRWRPIAQHSNSYSPSQPNEVDREIFMASLVYFNRPIRRFIDVSDPVAQPINAKTVNPRSDQSFDASDDFWKVRSDYPELLNFMENIATDKKKGKDSCSSHLYKARIVQNDFKWEISFMYRGSYKYCERIQRHHKSNNIYFVVDMRKGTYRQKCHDEDCKYFQGTEHLLPANTTPWLTVVNQDWDSQSPKSMKETL